MKIYEFECRRLVKTTLEWIVCVLLVTLLLIKGFYPAFIDSKDDVMSLLSNFPPELMAVFGMNIDKMFSYEGFYAFTYLYTGLLFSIMAVAVSVSVFAREKRSKCTDFLLTKPVTRQKIFVEKFLSCLCVFVVTNIVYIAVIGTDFARQTEDFVFGGDFILLMLCPFFTQLVFMSLGILYAVLAKRVRSVAGAATGFGVGAFVLSAVVNLLEKDALNVFSPLKYFDPGYLFDTGAFDPKLVISAVILFVCCAGIAYYSYCGRDVAAV